MNKYEQQAARQRQTGPRNSMTLWTAAAALVAVILVILGLSGSAPSPYLKQGAIAVAVLFLILRLAGRRSKGGRPRAAQPDPQSTLKLN